ncbi:DUF3592 domain-containing protein [Nocardiopsis coralliicola]
MFGLDTEATIALAVLGGAVLFNLAKMAWKAYRKSRRAQGPEVEAVVEAVLPFEPPQSTQHPFVLRYAAPSGHEYRERFDRGFEGVVPAEGWRVKVRYAPDDPANAEITENPYLHPIPGAPPAQRPSRAVPVAMRVGALAGVAAFAFIFVADRTGAADPLLPMGLFFIVIASTILVAAVASWRSQRGVREGEYAVGTVRHSWTERRRRRRDNHVRVTIVNAYSVEYAVADGRRILRRAPEASSHVRYQPGQQVHVYYDPSSPWTFSPHRPGGGSSAGAMVGIGLSVLFIAVGTVLVAFGLS